MALSPRGCAGARVRTFGLILRQLGERWPIVLVVPTFIHAGYTWPQSLIFGACSVALAELIYAQVRPRIDTTWPR